MKKIDVGLIVESQTNPRRRFDEGALAELAASIKEVGVLQPVLVRPLRHTGGYELVCGARRFRGAKLAGLKVIPAVVRELTDQQALHAQLVENNQRADVTAIEEARAFRALLDLGEAAAEVGARIGRPERYVRDRLALLELPAELVELVDAGRVRLGAAIALARLAPETRYGVAKRIVDEEAEASDGEAWTLAEVRDLVRNFQRYMDNVPWDLDDAELAPAAAGACETCPYRTGAQPDLFESGLVRGQSDQCTNSACFDARTADYWLRFEASGVRIVEAVPDKERARGVMMKGRYVDEKDLAERVGVEPVYVPRSWGPGYSPVYLRAELADALEARGEHQTAAAVRSGRTYLDSTPNQDRARQYEQLRQTTLMTVLQQVRTEQLDQRKALASCWKWLTRESPAHVVDKLLEAHHRKGDAKTRLDQVEQLWEEVGDRMAVPLLVELLARRHLHYRGDEALRDLASLAGVELPPDDEPQPGDAEAGPCDDGEDWTVPEPTSGFHGTHPDAEDLP